ncbi:MAG: SAM-dependent methyltransferase [Myxococcota bacterium]|jgi:SAM-dependent methyltransferase
MSDGAQVGLTENRARWDELVAHHVGSEFYDVDGFRSGRDTLSPIERAGLGDVSGKSLVHLQCHFGMDSLSWARSGAIVTGVDFSPKAIAAATALSQEIAVPARFVVSEVTAASEALSGEQFDIVYTAWGVLGWLPDLSAWAHTVAALLRPGGQFFIAETHPVAWLFDPTSAEPTDGLRQTWDYFGHGRKFSVESAGSYAAPNAPIQNRREHVWIYELAQVITALLNAGLTLTAIAEHDATCSGCLPGMTKRSDGLWVLPEGRPNLPLSFTISATKDR